MTLSDLRFSVFSVLNIDTSNQPGALPESCKGVRFKPSFRLSGAVDWKLETRNSKLFLSLALLLVLSFLTACGGKKTRAHIPAPPPDISRPEPTEPASPASVSKVPGRVEVSPFPPNAPVLWTETGMASWYGPPYNKRRAANGEIFDMNQLTAAHLTLPLNSYVRVTNLKTGSSAVVRITDRGPFVPDRIIDLSLGAAKALDVWRPGTAKVRLDVLEAPSDIAHGGRWCVQIGAFPDYSTAAELKQELKDRYATAKVIQFAGPTGEWVRVRVLNDDKQRAQQVADSTHTSAPVWLVRMD